MAFGNSILLNQLQIPTCVAVCAVGCGVRSQRKPSDRGTCVLGCVDSSCCARAESILGIGLFMASIPAQGGSWLGSRKEMRMKKCLLVVIGVAVSIIGLSSQGKRVLVVNAFTVAPSVELPYDMKLMQTQLVAELKVELGKEFSIVGEAPAAPEGALFTLDGAITGWRPGNAAKRLMVGLGSGREASDIEFQVTDSSGKKVLERKDTVRTNFYSQGAGSSGTLAHPIAQKVAERIKDAKLK